MTEKYLGIAAIVKNEAPYIEEWMEFHILQGVERFFIYDNDSTDSTLAKLLSFSGYVTIIPWHEHPGQMKAYAHAISAFKDSVEWLAFIDADEFLYSPNKLLPDVLARHTYSKAAAIGAHWYLYGSNGHETYTKEPVIARFTKRQSDVNPHVKTILRPKSAIKPISPHAFDVTGYVLDERGKELPRVYSTVENGSAHVLRVNHYHCKSKDEARKRWQTPRADNGEIRSFERTFDAHDRNDVEDKSAAIFADIIKARIDIRRKGDY